MVGIATTPRSVPALDPCEETSLKRLIQACRQSSSSLRCPVTIASNFAGRSLGKNLILGYTLHIFSHFQMVRRCCSSSSMGFIVVVIIYCKSTSDLALLPAPGGSFSQLVHCACNLACLTILDHVIIAAKLQTFD